jgi:uncharacterized protein
MRFNPKARLDTRQVQNLRGGAAGRGGAGFPVGGGGSGMKVGGGIGGVVVLVLVLVLMQYAGGGGGTGLPTGPASDAGPVSTDSQALAHCRTGADANEDPDCARVAVVNSIQSYWAEALPRQANREYVHGDTVIFSDRVGTGCGGATSDVGPFYCPPDQQVYLDTTFFRDMLEGQLGGSGGDFEEALDAARAVGDDRIQKRTSGQVDPDAWTHGSAEQRMRWFMTGREKGSLQACDTFGARSL